MLPKYLEDHPDFPFIVVSPQIPAPGSQSLTIPYDPEQYMETYGWNPWIERLELLLDAVQTGYRVDQGRVYLTGLSMGGFGVWNYALRYPARFAAIVPIAGGYRFYERTIPDNICDLKDLPVWAFHGGQDTTVPPWQSQILVDALTACGGKPLLTVYPDAGHDAWSQAYSDPDLYTWLLEKKK
jgi:predicted peptidase